MNATELPKVMYTGVLAIGPVELKVHVLDNGQRVIDHESLTAFWHYLGTTEARLTDEDAKGIARLVTGRHA